MTWYIGRTQQVVDGDLRGFFLRIFAKAVAKHPEKYLHFNRFSLLRTDSLDRFNSDLSFSIPVSVPVDAISITSNVSYKTSNGSTIPMKNTCKDSVLSHSAV